MSSEKSSGDWGLRKSVARLQDARLKSVEESKYRWPLYDADAASFACDFRDVIPGGREQFIPYIISVLEEGKSEQHAALELGGPGVRLFGDFPQSLFQRTMGVCLPDEANPVKENPQRPEHRILRGNLFDNELYRRIKKTLPEKGADLIISRMYGGLDKTPDDPAIWAKIGRLWYSLLSENGLMFVQFRVTSGGKWISSTEVQYDLKEKLMKDWVEFIQKKYAETLDIALSDYTFRLHKKTGAPATLPLLPSFDHSPIIKKVR